MRSPLRVGRSVCVIGIFSFLMMVPQLSSARIQFNPALELRRHYSSNALFTPGENARSDSYTSLALLLPLNREMRGGESSLTYIASVQRFDSLSSLDNVSHRLQAAVDSTIGRRSKFGIGVSYYLGQDQGNLESIAPEDQFFTPRNERQDLSAGAEFSHRLSELWLWTIDARYQDVSFSSVLDSDEQPSVATPVDRTVLGAGSEISKNISRRSNLGFGIGLDQFDLEESGVQTTVRVASSFRHQLSPRETLYVAAGVARSRLDAAGNSNTEDSPVRTGWLGQLRYTREYYKMALDILGAHGPTSGGNFSFTTVNTTLLATLGRELGRKLDGGLSARYSRATPTFEDQMNSPADSVVLGGSLSYQALRTLSLRLGGSVSAQRGGTPERPEIEQLTTNVVQAIFSLVWSPLAAKPIAGGE